MKKIVIAAVIILFIALIVAGAHFALRHDKNAWTCQNGVWIKQGNPSSPMPLEPCLSVSDSKSVDEINSDQKLIGGDKDGHGCLVGAGYSWCESTQKCVRPWEEICPPN